MSASSHGEHGPNEERPCPFCDERVKVLPHHIRWDCPRVLAWRKEKFGETRAPE